MVCVIRVCLYQRCDEIVKQLSLVKMQSDEKKRTLTDLRCMQIPTVELLLGMSLISGNVRYLYPQTQELQFQKDLIKTLESDLESQRQHNGTVEESIYCSGVKGKRVQSGINAAIVFCTHHIIVLY